MQGCRGTGTLRPLPALGSARECVHLKTAPVLKKPGQQERSCSSSAEELQRGDAGRKLKSRETEVGFSQSKLLWLLSSALHRVRLLLCSSPDCTPSLGCRCHLQEPLETGAVCSHSWFLAQCASPKYTGLWDSYLVLTWGPFSKTDHTVFLSQTVSGFWEGWVWFWVVVSFVSWVFSR